MACATSRRTPGTLLMPPAETGQEKGPDSSKNRGLSSEREKGLQPSTSTLARRMARVQPTTLRRWVY